MFQLNSNLCTHLWWGETNFATQIPRNLEGGCGVANLGGVGTLIIRQIGVFFRGGYVRAKLTCTLFAPPAPPPPHPKMSHFHPNPTPQSQGFSEFVSQSWSLPTRGERTNDELNLNKNNFPQFIIIVLNILY